MQAIRIIEIPDCKMVSSGIGMFGWDKFNRFEKWRKTQPVTVYPRDFLFWDGIYRISGGFHWLYMYEEGMDTGDFDVVDFKGGLYAVATDIDQKTKMKPMIKAVNKFLKANGLTRDDSRPELGNIITSTRAQAVLGYAQMDYYAPVKPHMS